jgi:hypothetical protein
MPFKHGDMAVYTGAPVNGTRVRSVANSVMVDEALDDDNYAVRFLDSDEVFTVHASELSV